MAGWTITREKPEPPHSAIAAVRTVEQPCAECDGLAKALTVKGVVLVE